MTKPARAPQERYPVKTVQVKTWSANLDSIKEDNEVLHIATPKLSDSPVQLADKDGNLVVLASSIVCIT